MDNNNFFFHQIFSIQHIHLQDDVEEIKMFPLCAIFNSEIITHHFMIFVCFVCLSRYCYRHTNTHAHVYKFQTNDKNQGHQPNSFKSKKKEKEKSTLYIYVCVCGSKLNFPIFFLSLWFSFFFGLFVLTIK